MNWVANEHFPSVDHIAFPNKGGAMENWGLITYGEPYFAFDEELSSAYGKQTIGSIQSHEMGHLVTIYNTFMRR